MKVTVMGKTYEGVGSILVAPEPENKLHHISSCVGGSRAASYGVAKSAGAACWKDCDGTEWHPGNNYGVYVYKDGVGSFVSQTTSLLTTRKDSGFEYQKDTTPYVVSFPADKSAPVVVKDP